MYYLVTDYNDMTERGVEWGTDITHEETNPNFPFSVYDHIPTALFMHPAYEGIQKPKIWEAVSENPQKIGFYFETTKLTTTKIALQPPITRSHRVTFAILCCLQIIQNPIFKKWAINYLRGIDTNKETAEKTQNELMAQMGDENIPPEHENISCAHACFGAVMLEDNKLMTANSAHRAYFDSPYNNRIDLQKLADIVLQLPSKIIADLIDD
jgi:hypothetical protein